MCDALNPNYNLMQASSNLGVVFGSTLIRPEVETVASIKDIKCQNIIVEIMIDEKDRTSRREDVCIVQCYCSLAEDCVALRLDNNDPNFLTTLAVKCWTAG
ncbi:rho GTPase-activating protein 26-like isoform X2 [Dysidea avara]|uniref:rho GTPase-activating protein 26-like isoform X2 n=1 Tax=Dysidea avara TaxID=196820 RepID=UPI0033336F79